jgi:exonuclease VII small subunit
MPKNTENKAMMKVIHKFSTTLSNTQLEEFVAIVESFSSLLDIANKDTQKAYKLYEQSFAHIDNDEQKDKTYMH